MRIVLWNITGQAQGSTGKSTSLNHEALEALWSDLGGDATKADGAIWRLAIGDNQGVPLLKNRMHYSPAPAEQVAKLIAALDNDRFAERQKAAQALEKLGETAERAVRTALAGNPPLEVRQRLQQFLEKRKADPEIIRKLRAIEVLEQIGTAEASQVLQTLVKESPTPRLAEAAAAALARRANLAARK